MWLQGGDGPEGLWAVWAGIQVGPLTSLSPAWLGGDRAARGPLLSPCPPPSLPQAKTKGNKVNVGVKYAEKQERKFEPEKLREGRNIIGLQVLPSPPESYCSAGGGGGGGGRTASWSLQALGTAYLALML